ncbi:myocardin-related transcription factor B isoform X3 [Rhineura floridana]|nr:myocardin-related transcription factor B isoform X3 [Rhineura floridana]XP_061455887.1 myocardin-related transcription factor B isoform X3 [Rhineura floridana]XP_061455888.1 myocardin-related transcription factor B isoform X3 [Rhineura floridana]XP_061455889.1 myocardin-related transcription factor B isoform X3 [Rhineura floridana]XP_061455890.1 myocardin-related transcription factor B isoform X3 [Rhineura floridana]XP_061455891.1 myocardin-related transcription factor B isoform X3 [Rhineur
MEHLGTVDTEDESGSLPRLAPSPHSEAVAHEFQELSLQPSQYLPPLNERKNVLQLRLQQRRTREQLVDQGIMPPLKSPAAFHEQIKSLERARTENFLKHKIRSRPDRSELVRMHILEETFAEPSLQATQMKLKRARLADDLNEKIAQRPGPMELVEKNILPVDSSVKEAIIAVGQENYPQGLDDFSFDEDSSDALSPDQPASQESQGSAASPGEPKTREAPSPVIPASSTNQYPTITSSVPEFLKPPVTDQQTTRSATAASLTTNTVSAAKHSSGPTLIKQPHPKNPSDKSRSKKSKEPKPRVKKLKYHQYIPPDQKGEKNEPQMDSNYARLLQQQQLFLQLQILSQQQQHYNYQAILPAPLKPVSDKQSNPGNTPLNTLSNSTSSAAASMPRQNNNISNRKPGPLPPSLDDLKVAELKMELKLRGLPVSGTKMDLIERLKPYQDLDNNSVSTSNTVAVTPSTNGTSNPGEVTAVFPVATLNKPAASSVPSFSSETASVGTGSKSTPMECINSPLPISPSPSEQSSLSTDDPNVAETLTEIMTMMSPSQFPNTSPLRATTNEDSHSSGNMLNMELDAAEKDRKLQEKEKQIEELKRKLEQEQQLVEVLKMQLEVEKRGQQQQPQASANIVLTLNQKHINPAVKEEGTLADCSDAKQSVSEANHSLGQPASVDVQNLVAKKAIVIKQEVPLAKAEPQNVISQFYVSSQRQPQTAVVAQPQAVLTAQGTAQLLLPVSLQGPNSATSVQLPVGNIQAQPQSGIPILAQVSTSSCLAQKVPQMHTSASKENASPQHALGQTPQSRRVFPPTSPNAAFSYQNQSVTTLQQPLFNQTSNTTVHSGNQVPLVQNGPSAPQKPASQSQSQQYILQQSLFSNSVTKTKDPPRYEEAIKQTRSLQASQREISSAHSQQMDDLFDILIKSGEISMPTKEEPSLISKMRPVTANITTMPVNTVVSRPPPQVQMAPPLSLEPTSNFSICLENQLEALLEGTLPSGSGMPQLASSNEDRESFSLIEDLQNDLLNHSGILDHSQSPMETTDSQFTTSNACLSLDLPDTNLDNMEWLDITMPNASSGLTPLSSTAPSMFSTDFLDPQDLQLHWD